jgi:hypothetical protein
LSVVGVVLSITGLCVGLITCPKVILRVVCLECDCEASIMMRPWPIRDSCTMTKKFCTVLMFIRTFIQFTDMLFKSSLQYSNINILLLKGKQKLILINMKHSLIQVKHRDLAA